MTFIFSRRPSARTTRRCQIPPSKLFADSYPSLAPRSTGTRSLATRSAKKCKTLRTNPTRFFLLVHTRSRLSEHHTPFPWSKKSPTNDIRKTFCLKEDVIPFTFLSLMDFVGSQLLEDLGGSIGSKLWANYAFLLFTRSTVIQKAFVLF